MFSPPSSPVSPTPLLGSMQCPPTAGAPHPGSSPNPPRSRPNPAAFPQDHTAPSPMKRVTHLWDRILLLLRRGAASAPCLLPARDRSPVLHPTSPGWGWQEEKGGTWQEQGHRHRARRGARVQGDPKGRNTYTRPRGHPYKNKSHLLRGSPAAFCTQRWGAGICAPQPPPHSPGVPLALGINTGDPHSREIAAVSDEAPPLPPKPSRSSGPRSRHLSSISPGGAQSLGPFPGVQPHSSGQPPRAGVTVLAPEPGPAPAASPAGHPGTGKPRRFAHASSLCCGAASLPLCAAVAPRPSRAVLASGMGSARGDRLPSGGVGPLGAG